MPLMLNTVETERPKQLMWNPLNSEESNEATERICSLVREGYKGYVSHKEGVAVLTPPKIDPNKFVFRVLSKNGDDRLVWDRRDLKQIEEAKEKFEEYLERGYKAYAVQQYGGAKGARLDSFDALYEEVIMAKGKEALMVPKTVPG